MPPSARTADGRRADSAASPRETIITAIRRWAELFGEPPCTADWNPSIARWRAQEWRIGRYAAGDPVTGARWPSVSAVKRRFGGSFDAAVREAGFEPRRPGPRKRVAGSARPAVPPGAPMVPRAVDDAIAAAAGRVQRADREVAAAQRRARAERVRADRALEQVDEARARARRSAERARRAIEARDRARARETARVAAAREACEDRLAAARAGFDQRMAEADARVRAAEARADAAEASARRVSGLAEADAPAGPAVLGAALTRLARARATGAGGGELRAALREVAMAATRWSERL